MSEPSRNVVLKFSTYKQLHAFKKLDETFNDAVARLLKYQEHSGFKHSVAIVEFEAETKNIDFYVDCIRQSLKKIHFEKNDPDMLVVEADENEWVVSNDDE